MKKYALAAAALIFAVQLSAQRVRLLDGDLAALKGTTKLNVEFDYSQMGVGKFETEDEYLEKKRAEYNEKEPGKGTAWAKAWKADRKNRFEPQFIELFAKHSDINMSRNAAARYTVIFKTTYTEPGFNAYVVRKNAEIDGEAWVVETANHSNVVAKISVQNCPGRTFGGYDFDTGTRVQESYATAGKGLGKFIKKEID